jgi:nucleoside-diphosphate-sugar epimerase
MVRSCLVTGGAGFIGSTLCDRLIAAGHRVVVLDNFVSGKSANLERSAAMAAPGQLTVHNQDVRSILDSAGAIGDVDVIFHLAALISGHDSLIENDSYVDANIKGLLRVIEFAAARKVGRIVFASSSTIYGSGQAGPLFENMPPAPVTVYAVTKLAGEHLLSLYGKLHDFSYCSLRLFNVYGPRQQIDHPYANVVCKFSYAAAKRLTACRYGNGTQSRDFIYVDDVIDAFIAVMSDSARAIYNVGTGTESSINSLIERLGRITGNPPEFEQRPAWPNDVQSVRADISLIEREFGFRPRFDLDWGLRATVDFFRDEARYAAGR